MKTILIKYHIVEMMQSKQIARAHEADQLMNVLASESQRCHDNQWPLRCEVIDDEIEQWIKNGALD